jgi:hypothetical protein
MNDPKVLIAAIGLAFGVLVNLGGWIWFAATVYARLKTVEAGLGGIATKSEVETIKHNLEVLEKHVAEKYTATAVLHERCTAHWERINDVREALEAVTAAIERRRR